MKPVVIALAVALTIAAEAAEQRFALRGGCVLPYADYAPARDVLHFCDNAGRREGTAPPPLADRLRLDAQNNLCASAANPVPITFDQLARLPARPRSQLQNSRSSLARAIPLSGYSIGEGTVVRMVAVVASAHVVGCTDDASAAITCGFLGGPALSEMQLNLGPVGRPGPVDCDAVVAKMTTHFRPVWWDEIDIKTPLPPVRVTGQLVYDDAAAGCRASAWEIHPVYAIDVCVGAGGFGCDAANDRVWQPYHKWVDQPGAIVKATGTTERIACREASLKWMSSHGARPQP